MHKYIKKLRHHFDKVSQLKTSAHSVALGVAIGTFISMFPTPFINLWIGLLAILLFRQINKYALFFTLLFWNPLTLLPFQMLSYRIGNNYFGSTPVVKYQIVLLNQIYYYTSRYLMGSLIISIPVSVSAYIITRYSIVLYLKLRRKK